MGSLDGGIVDGVQTARVMGVWRRTSADPEVVGRLCRAALERAEQVRRFSGDMPLDGVSEEMEMEGLTESISPRTRDAVPLLPTHEEEQDDRDGANDALEQLRALVMEEPDFDPKCTCAAKCHCIYGVSERRISRPAAAELTIRAEAAGLPPTSQKMSSLELGWYDKGKMPEGKRDSTRPKENEMPMGSDKPSPDGL